MGEIIWTECDEIADALPAHQVLEVKAYGDAEVMADQLFADQGAQLRANLADAIWRRARQKE